MGVIKIYRRDGQTEIKEEKEVIIPSEPSLELGKGFYTYSQLVEEQYSTSSYRDKESLIQSAIYLISSEDSRDRFFLDTYEMNRDKAVVSNTVVSAVRGIGKADHDLFHTYAIAWARNNKKLETLLRTKNISRGKLEVLRSLLEQMASLLYAKNNGAAIYDGEEYLSMLPIYNGDIAHVAVSELEAYQRVK